MDNVRVEIELIEDLEIKNGEFGLLVRVNGFIPAQDEDLPNQWEKLSQAGKRILVGWDKGKSGEIKRQAGRQAGR
jgi:hypothetical protein